GLCVAFNVDVSSPRLLRGPPEAQFGYKVLQRAAGGRKWLLVGAPWDGPAGDHRGDIYKCLVGPPNSTCTKVNLGDAALRRAPLPAKNTHFGMTLLHGPDGGFVACAPLWSQECGTSVFSTGVCTRVDGDLRPVETLAPTAQRCSTYMDIVIVLDGSNSIYPWYEVQNFLSNVLSKFFIGPGQIQVSWRRPSPSPSVTPCGRWRLLEQGRVLGAVLGCFRRAALSAAVAAGRGAAVRRARGARVDAGAVRQRAGGGGGGQEHQPAGGPRDPHGPRHPPGLVLGHYLRRQQDPEDFIREIRSIASEPEEKFFFNVTDEAALNDIVDALGDRIFSLEGTPGANASSFELEMSQIGFSIHLLEDGILFGMVGAYDWDGAVLKEGRAGRVVPPRKAFTEEFPLELKNHAAYLGYAVSSLRLPGGRRLHVAGAPRFQHKGKVILFELGAAGDVAVAQALTGEQVGPGQWGGRGRPPASPHAPPAPQIGSYFGSEVCVLDADGDGDTDVLLVAAPMFLGAQSKETGRVYIYRVGQRLVAPAGTLRADKKPQDSRFGYALAAVPDLNHDGFNDVLVGAPLEDGHRGAVYVYHGAPGTILPRYKQRIGAAALDSALSYFGRSLDARMDLTGDGLLDVAVGAQGAAVVLRTRQVVQVNTSLTVEPAAISVIERNCRRGGADAVCLRARICFRAGTRARGRGDRDIDLRYNVSLEERALGARAAFDSSSRRLLQKRLELSLGRQSCVRIPFHVLDTSDYLRPLPITVTLELDEAAPGPVLDEESPTAIRRLVGAGTERGWGRARSRVPSGRLSSQIPFFKECGEDDECVTDLVLRASMDIAGSRQSPYVLRKGRRKVLVEVALENREENAYNASVRLRFSRNLHFSSLLLQDKSAVKLECAALGGHGRLCTVGYPVFRARAQVGGREPAPRGRPRLGPRSRVRPVPQVTFALEFEFSCSVLLERAEVGLVASSDSAEAEATLHDNAVQLGATIRYEPDLFLSSDATLHRYEVQPRGAHGPGPEFKTSVKVQNLGCYAVRNLTLRMALPAFGYRGAAFLSVTRVIADNATCVLHGPGEEPGTAAAVPVHPEDLLHVDRLVRGTAGGGDGAVPTCHRHRLWPPRRQNCSTAGCQVLSCELGRLQRGAGVSVHVLRALHDSFFRAGPGQRREVGVGTGTGTGTGTECFLPCCSPGLSSQMELEILQAKRVPVSLWILVGSVVGGLLLLALIIFGLWKLGFFARKKLPEEEEEKEEQ
ncbi:ITA10 protein, partial [Nothocercus julius]|nr:ITA10 protein [Nothocercus julius]